jgi:putative addiction module killer protein
MPEDIIPKTVLRYRDVNGHEPYTQWIDGLRDRQGQQRIRSRIARLEAGLYGDSKSVGDGVYELRMFFGAGYRVYFGEDHGNIVLLLCGGDKDSQDRDIERAKSYWKEYCNHG